jgi:hypothetical protein
MDDYLRQHPDIFISTQKESHFFGSDLVFSAPRITRESYMARFSKATVEKRVGESSVWYLYSKHAATEIKDFCASASIIIMLRNPVDMIYSLHSQRVYSGNEDIVDFEAALEAEAARMRGLGLPRHVGKVMLHGYLYRETAKYTDQVRRYFEVFGREKIHIILFDDFTRDLAGIYRQTCEFLQVASNFEPEFRIINPNKRVRVKCLQRFMRRSSAKSQWLARTFPLGLGLARRVRKVNTKFVPRQPMNSELRKRLQKEFVPEVERLSELLGRDLTPWCGSRKSERMKHEDTSYRA